MNNHPKKRFSFCFYALPLIFITSCTSSTAPEDSSDQADTTNTFPNITILDNLKWDADNEWFVGYMLFEQNQRNGNLTGMHQFVRSDGNRIDFCEEHSIDLKFVKDSMWVGQMYDCYDDYTQAISVQLKPTSNIFIHIENNQHEFLSDTFSLYVSTHIAD